MFKIIFMSWLILPGQVTITSSFSQAYNCNEKKGCDFFGGGYKQDLIFKITANKLSWSKSIYEGFQTSEIRKETDAYVISRKDQLYTFLDRSSKTLYFFDHFRGAYGIWGYGPEGDRISFHVDTMFRMLKERKTQKDLVNYLIEQTKGADG
ncbi:MAG: hypothetical protein AAF789_05480 [Bacteroidota bacterium]